MPKFLDTPSWYTSSGVEVRGIGASTIYGSGLTASPASFYLNGEANQILRVSGTSVFNLYAPTSTPPSGLGTGVTVPYYDYGDTEMKWTQPNYVYPSFLMNQADGARWANIPYMDVQSISSGTSGALLYFNYAHSPLGGSSTSGTKYCIVWAGVQGGTITSVNLTTSSNLNSPLSSAIQGSSNFWMIFYSPYSSTSSHQIYISGMMSKGGTFNTIGQLVSGVSEDVNSLRILISGGRGVCGIMSNYAV